jgi:hypothetical protein
MGSDGHAGTDLRRRNRRIDIGVLARSEQEVVLFNAPAAPLQSTLDADGRGRHSTLMRLPTPGT